ncbi:hypothetical protein L228DRAFT_30755 [Xylona heveae TC161]|uniref:Glutamyl-tRNA amidotransferase complex subunit Gta3 domain-containing protein n=1 Tax=Xylona heveae (strain CBS 132557 / TC161) TaxID=1328760 RepID=A0A165A2M1_XYLHT|nr:hypothetical protein L228DRAFT_30755 [Xylona heveae TC161]KZF19868.1 hypothetical protein L228DRAFT_30755 [Xylona heveae TC161]
MSIALRIRQPLCHLQRLGIWQLRGTLFECRRTNSSKSNANDISSMLSKPTWSVRSLLPQTAEDSTAEITQKELHHLLRLSALPLPKSPEEEAEMLKTLGSQLHFVKEIQSVNTDGVRPLSSLRDETAEAELEQTIGLDHLKEAFAKEEIVGRGRRIRRKSEAKVNTQGAEDWDVLGSTSQKIGRFFVVESTKENST